MVYNSADTKNYYLMNQFILRNIKVVEMVGVMMRIFSFTLVSWLGPDSPFAFLVCHT
jgi:hypothetical protein